jgi:DNA-binding phage protein
LDYITAYLNMTSISALYTSDAVKDTQLYKTLAKGTPPSIRNTLKMNSTLSNQLLFVTNGTIGV